MPGFWDASSVVRLCVPGQVTKTARVTLEQFPPVIWWLTPVEVQSALVRLKRSGELSGAAHKASSARLTTIRESWRQVLPSEPVRDLATTLLATYPLKAADALQLAAALVWAKQRPRGRVFICNDVNLSRAAGQAGFDVRAV